ncbi:MAG: hemin transporter HemP [Blastopirellula sp.]|nr:MAG: hemin transporter HemP [Blastopirellula sp.]
MNAFNNKQSENSDEESFDYPRPRIINSEELMQGEVEILIHHNDTMYRLRETKTGKLILQK